HGCITGSLRRNGHGAPHRRVHAEQVGGRVADGWLTVVVAAVVVVGTVVVVGPSWRKGVVVEGRGAERAPGAASRCRPIPHRPTTRVLRRTRRSAGEGPPWRRATGSPRLEEHTSELQSRET